MKIVLNKYREFAKYINKEIKVKQCELDWYCYPSLKLIEMPKFETEEGKKDFLKSIEKKLPQDKKDYLNYVPENVWSFLHEVGHIQNNHNSRSLIRIISNLLGQLGLEKIANLFYFQMKEEKEATQWAIDYVLHNEEIVYKFSNEIYKSYKRYCKSCN